MHPIANLIARSIYLLTVKTLNRSHIVTGPDKATAKQTRKLTLGCFQLLYISKVLQARGDFLIPNEVVTRNHEGGHPSEHRVYTIRPRF